MNGKDLADAGVLLWLLESEDAGMRGVKANLTKDQIESALLEERTKKGAAKLLGVSVRTLDKYCMLEGIEIDVFEGERMRQGAENLKLCRNRELRRYNDRLSDGFSMMKGT